jgi:hypothetical protein
MVMSKALSFSANEMQCKKAWKVSTNLQLFGGGFATKHGLRGVQSKDEMVVGGLQIDRIWIDNIPSARLFGVNKIFMSVMQYTSCLLQRRFVLLSRQVKKILPRLQATFVIRQLFKRLFRKNK